MPRANDVGLSVQKSFPVLRLPPEIRRWIWRYAAVEEKEVMIYHHRRQFAFHLSESRLRSGKVMKLHQIDDKELRSSHLAVVFICRQLYLEITFIYYGENIFDLEYSWDRHLVQAFTIDIELIKASIIVSIWVSETLHVLSTYIAMLKGLIRVH